jgi:hypothetical protein
MSGSLKERSVKLSSKRDTDSSAGGAEGTAKRRGIAYPDSTIQAVRAAARDGGRSNRQIARDFGINESTVRKYTRDFNRPRQKPVTYNKYDNVVAWEQRRKWTPIVREMHWEGHTYNYIAKHLGLPVSTVWDYANRDYKWG